MGSRFANKKVLVTQADHYMGKPIAKAFADEGAVVLQNTETLQQQDQVNTYWKALQTLTS